MEAPNPHNVPPWGRREKQHLVKRQRHLMMLERAREKPVRRQEVDMVVTTLERAPDHRRADRVDVKEAVDFLECYHPDGPWRLFAQWERGEPWISALCDGAGDVAAFMHHHASHNIYFMPGDLRHPYKPMERDGLSPHDFTGSRYCWLDRDPPHDVNDLEAWRVAETQMLIAAGATWIVDSGRGLQAYWQLPRRFDPNEVESINADLEINFSGGDVWPIFFLMRLPGSVNSRSGRTVRVLWIGLEER